MSNGFHLLLSTTTASVYQRRWWTCNKYLAPGAFHPVGLYGGDRESPVLRDLHGYGPCVTSLDHHHDWGLSLASALPRGRHRGIKPFLCPVVLAASPHA